MQQSIEKKQQNGNMVTAILFTAIVLISIFATKSYLRKLLHGCCENETSKNEGDMHKTIDKKNYPYCHRILIYGMTCAFCKSRIENEFNRLKGYYIEVDLKNNCAVLYTMRPIVREDVINRIRSLGYHVFKIYDETK